MAIFPIYLFADRHGLSVYVKIELLLLIAHGITSERLKKWIFKPSGAESGSGDISRQRSKEIQRIL